MVSKSMTRWAAAGLAMIGFGCGPEFGSPYDPTAPTPTRSPAPAPAPSPQPPAGPDPTPPATTRDDDSASRPSGSSGACPVQPRLSLVDVGGPFTDCGFSDSTRVPRPTRMKHALQEMSGQTTCITPDFSPARWAFPNLPDVEISNSDQIYHNSGTFPGDVIFTGRNVVFMNTQNGSVRGRPVCGPGARNIEYDGRCICP